VGQLWKRIRVVVLVVAALAGVSSAASAQAGDVGGIVVDESGGVLPGATVRLLSATGEAPMERVSDAEGRFVFAGVAGGRHTLHVERALFRATDLQVDAGDRGAASLRVVLVIDSLSELVNVTYRPPSSSIGTKMDVPLTDIPQSIQVVPLAVLKDRGVTRIDQLVDTVSGIHAEEGYGSNSATFFNIRGFSTSNGLRDGFRNYGYAAARDVQAIDRVEVLKGPASVLYGASSSLGGYLNTVSKQPLPTAFTDVAFTASPYGVRPTIDANRPLTSDGRWSSRVNVAAEYNQTFRDQGTFGSLNVAPSLTWKPRTSTEVSAIVEYNYLNREAFDFGLPNIPDAASLSRTRYFGEPEDYGRNHTFSSTVVARHRFGNWTWREAVHFTRAKMTSTQSFLDAPGYVSGPIIDLWYFPYSIETDVDWASQSELSGSLDTGRIRHQLLVGFELARTQLEYAGLGDASQNYVTQLDLFDPSYATPLVEFYETTPFRQPTTNQGLYVQDLASIGAGLKVLGGVRTDWLQTRAYDTGVETDRVSTSQPSPRAGLIWQPRSTSSLYGSWSKAFNPVQGKNAAGTVFDPEIGTQFEIGLKQSVPAWNASATVAWFTLTRAGVLTLDPDNPAFYLQSGEQRSRGLEVDITAEPSHRLKWIASYSYIDAEVTEDNSFPIGDRLSNIPTHSGSLWATYRFDEGPWNGVAFGGGLVYAGERQATLPNTFLLKAYTRTDLLASYGWSTWNIQANVLNLFNQHYFTGGSAGVFNYMVNPSAPTTLQVTATRRF
jgi:iron complex outermembrane receptor protein